MARALQERGTAIDAAVGKPVIEVPADGPVSWTAREDAVRCTLGMYQAAEGYFSGTDPLLGTLLGRPPRPVRDALGVPA